MACNSLTIDVEDWFHILDSPAAPTIEEWPALESRIERNVEQLLAMLDSLSVKVTFFWLGWAAERHKSLVRKCYDAGNEIASHGFGHVLAYKVGRQKFKSDIEQGRKILEDIIGDGVRGFRAAGFGIKDETIWAFNAIKEAGYEYDSSIFPSSRGHGGMLETPLGPFIIQTKAGPLPEISMSAVTVIGKRLNLFGGGYLRLAPRSLIEWGIGRLHKAGHPLIVYVHPREIDPAHPRLPLSPLRRFKSYVNLKTTMPKLEWLCRNYEFVPMYDLVKRLCGNLGFVGLNLESPIALHPPVRI